MVVQGLVLVLVDNVGVVLVGVMLVITIAIMVIVLLLAIVKALESVVAPPQRYVGCEFSSWSIERWSIRVMNRVLR